MARTTAQVSTEDRLLAVAERLFAEHGVDAVSVRSITIEAGANIAAVHYHFGTKTDLVRALVERRIDEVNRARLAMLRDLERGATVTAVDVARAWVEPLAALALDPDRAAYLGFVVALLGASPQLRALSNDAFRPHYPRLDAALERALPDLEPALRRMRFGLAAEMSLRALASLDALRRPWRADHRPVADHELVAHITDAFTGLLLGGRPNVPERTHR